MLKFLKTAAPNQYLPPHMVTQMCTPRLEVIMLPGMPLNPRFLRNQTNCLDRTFTLYLG